MSRPTVFVTQPIDEESLATLELEATVVRGYGPHAVTLESAIANIDALLVRTERIDAALISRAHRLRVIHRVGIGIDKIDIDAASAAGVPVFNTAGANANTVAEMTVGLALSVARQIPRWDSAVRAGNFAQREQDPGTQLHGKIWGIVGLGHIGQAVARIAGPGLGMSVLTNHPSRNATWAAARGAVKVDALEKLLAASDVVSLHVPLTDATRNLIGSSELGLMRKGSILVNMSRGGVVDEGALALALSDGPLAGAGVDVFADEPPLANHPFFGLSNVVLSPHRGGRTTEATEVQGVMATRRLLHVLRGGSVDDALNAHALDRPHPSG